MEGVCENSWAVSTPNSSQVFDHILLSYVLKHTSLVSHTILCRGGFSSYVFVFVFVSVFHLLLAHQTARRPVQIMQRAVTGAGAGMK